MFSFQTAYSILAEDNLRLYMTSLSPKWNIAQKQLTQLTLNVKLVLVNHFCAYLNFITINMLPQKLKIKLVSRYSLFVSGSLSGHKLGNEFAGFPRVGASCRLTFISELFYI